MPKVEGRLLRPLNGEALGTKKIYDLKDALRLRERGVFHITGEVPLSAPSNKMDDVPATKSEPVSMAMKRDELVAAAKERGVEIESDDNKASIIRKIEAAGKGE